MEYLWPDYMQQGLFRELRFDKACLFVHIAALIRPNINIFVLYLRQICGMDHNQSSFCGFVESVRQAKQSLSVSIRRVGNSIIYIFHTDYKLLLLLPESDPWCREYSGLLLLL